ncbi:preprotein translocase subunit SecG [Luteithermobacter gelatinilyticus]|uniref:preprotein translocase subunit SecG n=1 Tax=Luteithermobacter gelatinilyticus TaxID=2582913 RepID=UPI00110597D7|nr:preprotein translocase subunit SecG [Luteithermobacter gelatinilyticus]|tara:strand:+ start:24771 stop:25091 length:321 start_codon:yes stop_codon:yes gene_type:complete
MQEVILVIHLILAIALVVTILLQQSEGGALGIGGGPTGLISSRSAANLLTRTTAVLAGAFFITSLVLAILAKEDGDDGSVLDQPPAVEAEQPETELPKLPEVPVTD